MKYIIKMRDQIQVVLGEKEGVLSYFFNRPAAELGLHIVVSDNMTAQQAVEAISENLPQGETATVHDRPNDRVHLAPGGGQSKMGMAA